MIGLFDGSLRSVDLETGWTDATWRGHYSVRMIELLGNHDGAVFAENGCISGL